MKMNQSLFSILLIFCFSCILFSCIKNDGATPSAEKPFTPVTPTMTGDPFIDSGLFGDIIRDDYLGLLRDPALYAINREFGPTVITIKKFPAKVDAVSSKKIPWSSWWYPKKETFIFEDSEDNQMQSTLTKFDLLRRSRNSNAGSAADFEKNKYSANSLAWEGLCDAWALASISTPEPKRPVKMILADGSRRSVIFTIADLKALTLKTFEAIESTQIKTYGQKFTGNVSGWIHPDLFPEQFHRFIEIQIMQNQKSFVMDHDPGIEVWNIPIFRANYTMDLIPNQPDSVMVTMYLYSAESTLVSEKNFVGTKQAVREYNYVLHGKRNEDGNLVVTSGYWIKGLGGADSRNDHPDFAIVINNALNIQQKSWNPEIDIHLANEILAKSY